MIVQKTADGQPDSQNHIVECQGIPLSESFTVTRYRPRVERAFSRIEYWQPMDESPTRPFWLVYTADGQLHCLGKNASARIADPADNRRVAIWLLEESVSPTGEHICYTYRAEDDTTDSAQQYLSHIYYGNLAAKEALFSWDTQVPTADNWLFTLVFDYGERSFSVKDRPTFNTEISWPVRLDCFSRYEYGFNLRTRRLCHQILMFHRLKALSGEENVTDETPALVSRWLLAYEQNTAVTTLVSCRHLAHEETGNPCALPPLEFGYQTSQPTITSSPWQPISWQQSNGLNGFQDGRNYQLVDLYGEGIPGILYQDQGAWWYRAPQRDGEVTPENDTVTYSAATRLPQIPSLRDGARLMDMTGSGRLDWVVTQANIAGYYGIRADKTWTHFTPLSALPSEFFHPAAQQADLMGHGLFDLVLIEGNSVRVYANQRDGFSKSQGITLPEGVSLPTPTDSLTWLAFSDVLGSGQPHWVQIRHDGVTCWPNLGQGRFGQPITLPGFEQPRATFQPNYVFLADLDGSGLPDLVYAQSDRLLIYCNQSGNHFAEPKILLLPPDIRYDDSCQITLADIQGQGVTSVILSLFHPTPRHWRCDWVQKKSNLLTDVNNNRGMRYQLQYRSSAQCWLDEKATVKAQPHASDLPFPLHLLTKICTEDEITGNRLTQVASYSQGVYDNREREFRGFGRVDTWDTETLGNGANTKQSRTWYHTGQTQDETRHQHEFWAKDSHAFPRKATLFTTFNRDQDQPTTPTEEEAYWLYRALNGSMLRTEVYGLDGDLSDKNSKASIPYTVSESRYQVRRIQASMPSPERKNLSIVVLPLLIEQRDYYYERIISDPQCQQQILFQSDEWGYPLHSATLHYPRRPRATESPYPTDLPLTSWSSSYDQQQEVLRSTVTRQRWHHLTTQGVWRLGLPDLQQTDILHYAQDQIPEQGLSREVQPLNPEHKTSTFAGQQQIFYTANQSDRPLEKPTVQALVAFTETAVLNERTLTAFADKLTGEALERQLVAAGYLPASAQFSPSEKIWLIRQGQTDYANSTGFYRPLRQCSTSLMGKSTLTWDKYYCVIKKITDSVGQMTEADYDYRFLTPFQIKDLNDNTHWAQFDALGRLCASGFYGIEEGIAVGFPKPEPGQFHLPRTVDEALAWTGPLPVAQFHVFAVDSWMMKEPHRLPPHIATVVTDRYVDNAPQKLSQQVMFSDGFGRLLQTSVRHEAGTAYQRHSEGALMQTAPQFTARRWAVTGRKEYDHKGQPVRIYPPYYLDDWRYVNDDSARENRVSDVVYYDPLGREIQKIDTKGYLSRTRFFPWFTVHEDENDTAAEVLEKRQQNMTETPGS
ncbi:SpvB/TcaC N-terminal domain-containing protein [Candidatus Fukatsuia symbiotica]|uniref:SpvB/TcaC N-terminal domain-containing protein n=1 Tax=Candidatus Fukatsuia TaxID=1927833 RepID=UPI0009341BF6|nr:SpvB/TcaC N-terminal domain-containing protein [Candidatus Fukatsuia symbiotica]MEA9445351.1 SpvB/TcaC N-terminal domain-containing protein [Candidatus Fukatsuia symbiotica]